MPEAKPKVKIAAIAAIFINGLLHKGSTRSFTLARLRRHREAFLNPRLPERCLAGDGSGRLIAVEVETERRQDRLAERHDEQGRDAGPRLVEPHQGAGRTLADALHHAAQ